MARLGLWVTIGISALAAALLACASAPAEDWPTRPIRIMVGFGPGGATDIAARIVAPPLSEILGQPVVVENRPGAGGTTAANSVAIAPKIYKSIPYDPVKDFDMISMVATSALVVLTYPDFPAKNLKELIGVLKASPGKYNFATT